jgi:hypothetical protein
MMMMLIHELLWMKEDDDGDSYVPHGIVRNKDVIGCCYAVVSFGVYHCVGLDPSHGQVLVVRPYDSEHEVLLVPYVRTIPSTSLQCSYGMDFCVVVGQWHHGVYTTYPPDSYLGRHYHYHLLFLLPMIMWYGGRVDVVPVVVVVP